MGYYPTFIVKPSEWIFKSYEEFRNFVNSKMEQPIDGDHWVRVWDEQFFEIPLKFINAGDSRLYPEAIRLALEEKGIPYEEKEM